MSSYLFDRRSMALLLSGMSLAGLLLFGTGVLVGLGLQPRDDRQVATVEFRPLASEGPSAAAAPASSPAVEPAPAPPPPATVQAPEIQPASDPAPAPLPAESAPARTASAAGVEAPERMPLRMAELQQVLETAEVPASAAPAAAPPLPLQPEPAVDEGADRRAVPAALIEPRAAAPLAVEPSRVAPPEEPSPVPLYRHSELRGPDGEPTYAIQVAAFELRRTAGRVGAELLRQGLDAYLVPFETPSGRGMYSVRFGRFADAEAAYEAARDFERIQGVATLVRLQLTD